MFFELSSPIQWEEVSRAILTLGDKAVSLDLIKDSILKNYIRVSVSKTDGSLAQKAWMPRKSSVKGSLT
jgi:hypothetical protein